MLTAYVTPSLFKTYTLELYSFIRQPWFKFEAFPRQIT